jgi:hypothetical protein
MISNFNFLQSKWPQLVNYGELAEKYLYSDSNASLAKLRLFGEKIVQYIFQCERLEEYISVDQIRRIDILTANELIDNNISNILHDIRKKGNKAIHEGYSSESCAKELIEGAYKVSVWLMETYGQWDFKAKSFSLDTNVSKDADENLAEIIKLEKISEINETIATTGVNTEEIKVGKLVRETFKSILEKENITNEMLYQLQEEAYSKRIFDINFAFLKKVNMLLPIVEQRKVKKYPRYWKETYKIYGENYILCNDWYIRNKSRYVKWLLSLGETATIQDLYISEADGVTELIKDDRINEKTRTHRSNVNCDDKAKENKVAYYLSRFEHAGLYASCNQMQAFKIIAEKLNMNYNTLKNKRDYFDPHCNVLKSSGPKRKGWWQAELPYDLKSIYDLYLNKSKEEIEDEVKEILSID